MSSTFAPAKGGALPHRSGRPSVFAFHIFSGLQNFFWKFLRKCLKSFRRILPQMDRNDSGLLWRSKRNIRGESFISATWATHRWQSSLANIPNLLLRSMLVLQLSRSVSRSVSFPGGVSLRHGLSSAPRRSSAATRTELTFRRYCRVHWSIFQLSSCARRALKS